MVKRIVKILMGVLMLCVVAAGLCAFVSTGSSYDIPVISAAKNTKKGVSITWTSCKSAKGYDLYRQTDGEPELIGSLSREDHTFCDEKAKNGEAYTYFIAAIYKKSKTVSASVTVTRLKTPVIRSVTDEIKGVLVKWSKVSGADKYLVYKKKSSGKGYLLKSEQKETTFFDTAVKNGKRCIYYVVARTGDTSSGISDRRSVIFISAPRITQMTNKSSGVEIRWKPIQKTDGYRIYRKADAPNGKWKRLGSVTGAQTYSYIDISASSGKAYFYTVRAYRGDTKSGYYATGARNIFLKTVSVKKGKYENGAVVLRWTAQKMPTGYYIYRKENSADFKKLATVKKPGISSYTDKKVKSGTRYTYAISAYKGSFRSARKSFEEIKLPDINKPMLALTFDDGPYGPATNRILDVLEKYDSRATFFVVGDRVGWTDSTACIKRAYDMGCVIGNHTYNHQILTYSSADVKKELSATSDAVKAVTGQGTPIMRPPGGSFNDSVKKKCRYPMIMWSVDTRDWESRDADAVLANIKRYAYDGAIILMHDLYNSTASAVERAVPWLIGQGYQLVTVPELMEAKGITMQNGCVYYDA